MEHPTEAARGAARDVGAGAKTGAVRARRGRPRTPPRLVRNRNGARVRINGRDFYCGVWGSAEAKRRYAELIAEWAAHDGRLPTLQVPVDPAGTTVNELIALYSEHELPTRPESMRLRIKLALRPLHERYGTKLANQFTALDLSALRASMIAGGRLSRAMANGKMTLIRGLFTWAASMGRCDERVPFRLAMLKPLRRGQAAHEARVVQPIDWPTVAATIAQASDPVRGLILFQWYTGARPGEACMLTADAIDRSGSVWIYVPRTHKTQHHGKTRRIHIGAEGQALLRPFLLRRPETLPLFSPTEAMEQRRREDAAARRTRVQPSQAARARRWAARPRREFAEGYDVAAYRRAIERAVDAANAQAKRDKLRAELLPLATGDAMRKKIEDAIVRLPVFIKRPTRARLVRRIGDALRADDRRTAEVAKLVDTVLDAPGIFERWHPHRLRHAFAQRAERETGDLDAVRASLGHSGLAMAARYAHPDDRKARELAERIG